MSMRVEIPDHRTQPAPPPEIAREVDTRAPSRRRRARLIVAGLTGLALCAGFGGGVVAGVGLAPTNVVVFEEAPSVGPCVYAAPAPEEPDVYFGDQPAEPTFAEPPAEQTFAAPPCCMLNRGCFLELQAGKWSENPCTPGAMISSQKLPSGR